MQKKLKMAVTGNSLQDLNNQKFDIVFSVLIFLYCAMLPFEEALASSFGSVLRLLGILIIGYCVCIYTRYPVRVRNLRFLVPVILWLMLAAISVLWSKDLSWWSYFIKIYAVQFIFVLFVVAYYQRLKFQFLENGLILGSMMASSVLIFLPQVSQITKDGRRTFVVFGQDLDPNIVACIIMLGLFACLRRIFEYQYRGIFNKLVIIYLAIGMLFTGSRGALISFVIGGGVLLLLEMKNRGSRKRVIFVAVIFVAAAVVALAYMPEELLTNRFSSDTILGINEYEDGSHNRYTIWMKAIKLFKESPIIGYGCGNFFSAIATIYEECASHNMYVLVAIEEGIVGLLIFGFALFCIFRGLYKRKLYISFGMFTSICVMALTLDTLTYKYFWVALIIVLVTINLKDDGKNEGIEDIG